MKTLKLILFLCVILVTNGSFKELASKDDFYILVSKHKYSMSIYDAENNLIVEYPAAFGSDDLGDKMFEGDRKTPEGIFHILSKRKHPKWNKFLAIDYPNEESYRKFYERRANGEIPANAKIGGSIGIHGTWPEEDFAVENHQSWTLGCVSTTNTYVDEIYNQLPVGTRVIIEP